MRKKPNTFEYVCTVGKIRGYQRQFDDSQFLRTCSKYPLVPIIAGHRIEAAQKQSETALRATVFCNNGYSRGWVLMYRA